MMDLDSNYHWLQKTLYKTFMENFRMDGSTYKLTKQSQHHKKKDDQIAYTFSYILQ